MSAAIGLDLVCHRRLGTGPRCDPSRRMMAALAEQDYEGPLDASKDWR